MSSENPSTGTRHMQLHNDTPPIFSLPNEILVEIFSEIPLSDRKTLICVCRRLRSIGLAAPSLWAIIDTTMSPDEMNLLLERAKKCPLTVIHISNDRKDHPKDTGGTLRREMMNQILPRTEILKASVSYAAKYDTSYFPMIESKAPLSRDRLLSPMPLLRKLQLNYKENQIFFGPTPEPLPGPLFGGNAPHLIELVLHGVLPTPNDPILTRLTNLVLQYIQPLCTPSQLREIISPLVQLDSLDITRAVQSVPMEGDPIVLPRLRYFCFEALEYCVNGTTLMPNHISVPQIQHSRIITYTEMEHCVLWGLSACPKSTNWTRVDINSGNDYVEIVARSSDEKILAGNFDYDGETREVAMSKLVQTLDCPWSSILYLSLTNISIEDTFRVLERCPSLVYLHCSRPPQLRAEPNLLLFNQNLHVVRFSDMELSWFPIVLGWVADRQRLASNNTRRIEQLRLSIFTREADMSNLIPECDLANLLSLVRKVWYTEFRMMGENEEDEILYRKFQNFGPDWVDDTQEFYNWQTPIHGAFL